MENNRWIYTLLFVLFIVSVALTGCGKKEEKQEPVARPIKVMTLGTASGEGIKKYPGKVDADHTVDVSFEVAGQIINLPIQRGMNVEKGQLLAELNPTDFENNYKAKKAEFLRAEAELSRYRELYENDAVSVQELEIRQTDRDIAAANYKIAEKALKDTKLLAPFAGVISKKDVKNFESIVAKQSIARLQDLSMLEVNIHIPESDVAIKPSPESMSAFATFDTIPGRQFPLTIKEFETEADPVTQTFTIKFSMKPAEELKILPGMTANVTVLIDPKKGNPSITGILIPSTAVLPDASGHSYVWLVDPATQTVKKQAVTLGEMTGANSIQVLEGLKEGDVIATAGISSLTEGQKVRVLEPKQNIR